MKGITMLRIGEAVAILESLLHERVRPPEDVELTRAAGRISAEEVVSEVELPPQRRSTRDGYSLSSEFVEERGASGFPVRLPVRHVCHAGDEPPAAGRGEAVRIMTGAPLPEAHDTVIMFEEAEVDCSGALVLRECIRKGRWVNPKGADLARGETLVRRGEKLSPGHCGLLAMAGRTRVSVHGRPRVALVITGDEVAERPADGGPWGVCDANTASLSAAVETWGGVVAYSTRAADDEQDTAAKLEQALRIDCDIVLTTGGVSAGDRDLVPAAWASVGARVCFHKAAIRPGKPLYVARATRDGVAAIGLPGNPMSALTCFELFVKPLLLAMGGRRKIWPSCRAVLLGRRLKADPARRWFVPGNLILREKEPPVFEPGDRLQSSALTAMRDLRWLGVLPEGGGTLERGEPIWCLRLDEDGLTEEVPAALAGAPRPPEA